MLPTGKREEMQTDSATAGLGKRCDRVVDVLKRGFRDPSCRVGMGDPISMDPVYMATATGRLPASAFTLAFTTAASSP